MEHVVGSSLRLPTGRRQRRTPERGLLDRPNCVDPGPSVDRSHLHISTLDPVWQFVHAIVGQIFLLVMALILLY